MSERLRSLFPFLLTTLLVVIIASSAEFAFAQNLISNGDFSNGLSNWTPVVSDRGRAGDGYPKWGVEVDPHVGIRSAYLDVPAGAFAWLDSDPFFMPNTGTVTVTMWGHHDSVDLGVQVVVVGPGGAAYVLDHFDPPKTEYGQTPVTRDYVLGTNVAWRNIAIRLTCHDFDDHWVGTFCDFANVIVTSQQSPPPPPPPETVTVQPPPQTVIVQPPQTVIVQPPQTVTVQPSSPPQQPPTDLTPIAVAIVAAAAIIGLVVYATRRR